MGNLSDIDLDVSPHFARRSFIDNLSKEKQIIHEALAKKPRGRKQEIAKEIITRFYPELENISIRLAYFQSEIFSNLHMWLSWGE